MAFHNYHRRQPTHITTLLDARWRARSVSPNPITHPTSREVPDFWSNSPIAAQKRADFAAARDKYLAQEATRSSSSTVSSRKPSRLSPDTENHSANGNHLKVPGRATQTTDVATATGEQNVNAPLVPQTNAYKHDPSQRIFVGRSLRLEKMKFFGFDMDYTLANYKSPAYEGMLFSRTISRMIDIGYPEQLRSLTYNSNFPVRGLWFDMQFGNLLKVDGFGNILVGVHGFHFMKPYEIEEQYPNKFLHLNDSRVIILNTLFNMPDTYLLASLVDYFDTNPDYKILQDRTGVRKNDVIMSYKSFAKDLTDAVHWVHTEGSMKQHVLQNIDQYVVKDERIKQLLPQLRRHGQTFLLTNSEYSYTNGVMTYLLGSNWTEFFDISVVDAKKPHWFAEGTVFRQVDTSTGVLKLGMHTGPLKRGQVYAGGSCDAFRRMLKARGKDVLYIGDHIFGDVLRSKKNRGWRTFLIVPEIEHELTIWTERHGLFERLAQLDVQLAKLYKNMDATSANLAHNEIGEAVKAIRNLTHEMDQAYGVLGPLFRSGSRTTFFATQVERYADLYAASPYNLIYYPAFYFFRAPMMLMPHESTVDHLAKMNKPAGDKVGRQPSKSMASFCHEDIDDEPLSEEDAFHDTSSSELDKEISLKNYVKKSSLEK
ncbi:unnamed protein product [Bursaphelenchus okinawaensis]|uniref:Uncharacterized protein n=1 Tax=Bursaphelenchus okinawaensis TaxID=465554 RepID=A0A811KE80_9BILA|nr:unnamed protein product [Bursaphelenchus okinawaensis]CAG9099489.1 unnamed protein product [Bursaphelenchus okinawaensis]